MKFSGGATRKIVATLKWKKINILGCASFWFIKGESLFGILVQPSIRLPVPLVHDLLSRTPCPGGAESLVLDLARQASPKKNQSVELPTRQLLQYDGFVQSIAGCCKMPKMSGKM